ncbi:MAG: DUF4365 domain-containing protein [Mucilaginibacter sp.]|uniref:DUF4365 domain-containing protein n=1 Tax=Mucilaginibacter sp. TaxID=1882438 RepID=UPI003264D3BB
MRQRWEIMPIFLFRKISNSAYICSNLKLFMANPKPKRTKLKTTNQRTTRTREHVISDLSVHFVEGFVYRESFTCEVFKGDYGYDLNIYTYTATGEFENGNIFVQLKASDRPKYLKKKSSLSFSMSKKHIEVWFDEPFPVILIIYDAIKLVAYWIYLQKHLRSLPNFSIANVGKSYTVNIPLTNILDNTSMQLFRIYKSNTLNQMQNVITYQ